MKTFLFYSSILLLLTNTSCNNANDIEDVHSVDNEIEEELNIEVIDSLPIAEGTCTICFFSINKDDFNQRKYIWIDNAASRGFMKINGKLESFILEGRFADDPTHYWSSEKNGYQLELRKKEVENKGRWIGSYYMPSQIFEGEITIKSSSGSESFEFYGECGCLK